MSDEKKLDQLRRIEEELKCIVCVSLIDDPHTLMCGHSFCGQCLLRWFAQKKACPTCRSPTIKQPVHNITLQKIIQLVWPENRIPERKLQRTDWLDLYPVQNQGSYIRDEDGDGVIYRCSNCAWELDEEMFCGQCLIYYDDGEDRSNARRNDDEVTDTESHHDQDEEDLEDFVVEDDHVEYENLDQDHVLDETSSEEDSDVDMGAIHINDDDSEEDEVQVRSRKRRRIRSDDDDSSVNSVISIEDDDVGVSRFNSNNRTSSRFIVDVDDEEEEEEESEDEEYPDDPFPRKRNIFIDDYAEEDEDEERITPKQPKIDSVTQLITNAQAKMRAESSNSKANASSQIEINSDDDPSSSTGSDDEPDYDF